jgi:hypothetical protein
LQRYIEAEEAFQKVLSFDPECEDARQQLLDVQVMQLCERGYRKEHALKALYLTLNDTHTTNVEVILCMLSVNHFGHCITISDRPFCLFYLMR